MGEQHTRILNVRVNVVEQAQLIRWIVSTAARGSGGRLTYLTAWSLVLAQRDPLFLRSLAEFDLVYSDGMGVVWAAWCLGAGPLKKVTANDFIFELCGELGRRSLTVALVGAEPSVVKAVGSRLVEVVPRLKISCNEHGFFSATEEEAVKHRLRSSRPDVVFVAMGQPNQEAFALRCASELPSALFYCVGGLFDVLAGVDPTPPQWVRNSGMEWLFRLVTRPRAVWRRYVLGLPRLAVYVLCARVGRRATLQRH